MLGIRLWLMGWIICVTVRRSRSQKTKMLQAKTKKTQVRIKMHRAKMYPRKASPTKRAIKNTKTLPKSSQRVTNRSHRCYESFAHIYSTAGGDMVADDCHFP